MGMSIGVGATHKYGRPLTSETITVDNTSGGKALTPAKYTSADTQTQGLPTPGLLKVSAREALISLAGTAGTNDIRFTVDGATAPVATTTGHLVKAPSHILLQGFETIKNFRAIREGANSGTIYVTYFL